MTKNEVVQRLAERQEIEKMANKVLPDEEYHNIWDLAQDIYLQLLEMDDDKVVQLYQRKELGFFILKIHRTQVWCDNTKYKKNYMQKKGTHSENSYPRQKLTSIIDD